MLSNVVACMEAFGASLKDEQLCDHDHAADNFEKNVARVRGT